MIVYVSSVPTGAEAISTYFVNVTLGDNSDVVVTVFVIVTGVVLFNDALFGMTTPPVATIARMVSDAEPPLATLPGVHVMTFPLFETVPAEAVDPI